ncbi:MAG: hypothetical protein SGARI_000737, partial [Bacillariaceae sp.]
MDVLGKVGCGFVGSESTANTIVLGCPALFSVVARPHKLLDEDLSSLVVGDGVTAGGEVSKGLEIGVGPVWRVCEVHGREHVVTAQLIETVVDVMVGNLVKT